MGESLEKKALGREEAPDAFTQRMQGRRRVRRMRTHLPQLLLEGILLLAALGLLLGRWPAGVRTGVGDGLLIDGFDILSPRLAPGEPRDLEHTWRGRIMLINRRLHRAP